MFIPSKRIGDINFMFMTPGQKFSESLDDSPYNPATFARLMDVDPQTINNWKSRGVSGTRVFEAAKYLGKDPQWLKLDDRDLPDDFTPEEQEREDYAVALFDILSEDQKAIIENLLIEFAKVPPSSK